MDVQTRELSGSRTVAALPAWVWPAALAVIVAAGLLLRLPGISHPIVDHPGWRQGDTAAIARNFAQLNFNIVYPQTTYNGPPPNYVELELQIVPFLSAIVYKIAGVHVWVGRAFTILFSLATIALLAYFARWLFASSIAGLSAAAFYAVFPGSVYYGRTFTPDGAMVFFLTAALYSCARALTGDAAFGWRQAVAPTVLLTLAYLAKPVAIVAFVPLCAMLVLRYRDRRATNAAAVACVVLVPLLILAWYDRAVASHAEWHWASGITSLHVVPALRAAFTGVHLLLAKIAAFWSALGLIRATMLGSAGFALAAIAFVLLPWSRAKSATLLWSWLIAELLYVFVVMTVERVDYYAYSLLPLAALALGGAAALLARTLRGADIAQAGRWALAAAVPVAVLGVAIDGRAAVAPYYAYNAAAYRNAVALDRALPDGALIVQGHYGPDVQYYIDRFGWEEDPMLWTTFDEESAIRKGARYFVSIEDNRLHRNVELCAWLQRFPLLDPQAAWPVYVTDPQRMVPDADAFWRAFRTAERAHHGRDFLDAAGVCRIAKPAAPTDR
ncbi:MAG TPA: glycosyltransferase family 39 protein [Candidatus Tumulicola sp.]